MKDDFFAQIQAAEQKAQKMVNDAAKRSQDDLVASGKSFENDRSLALEKDRERAHEALAKKQVEAKEFYAEQISNGAKEVSSLTKAAEAKLPKIQASLEAYFLSDIIA